MSASLPKRVPRLPRITSKQLLRALKRAGFFVDHTTGSHYILYKDNFTLPISVPYHNQDMKLGTLSAILKQAKISVTELINFL